MNSKAIALQTEHIDELLTLLAEGRQSEGISSQLRAHQLGHLPHLTRDHAQKVFDALGEVFDRLQQKSDSIKHALPLITEKLQKDLEPAQKKAKELVARFDAVSEGLRGAPRQKAQLDFHQVISREMEAELNKVAAKWGQHPVTLDWCDYEVGVLSRIIPMQGGILAPLGQEFARLVNPQRLWELQVARFDQLDLRIRIIEQRNALQSLFNLPSTTNVVSLVD